MFNLSIDFKRRGCGIQTLQLFFLTDRPKIVGSREAIEEGRELLLYCEVQGNSTPQTGWLINERLIPQQRERYLHIQNVTLTDAGSYKCCAFYQLRFSLTRFCSVKMPLQVKCK